jgi:hypothetical protein
VSERKRRSVRESSIKIHYFLSIGSAPIRGPPDIPQERGIAIEDIYVHKSDIYQAWRCVTVTPQLSWTKLTEGIQESGKDGKTRTFVITHTGLPGWVAGPTVDRKYKPRTTTASPTREVDGYKGKGKERQGSSTV